MRRVLVKAILAMMLTLAVGGSTIACRPVVPTTTHTTYCFRYANGSGPYRNNDVFAQRYVNGQWVQIGHARTNVNGCGAFSMPPNSYVRVMAHVRLPNAVFRGYTNWTLTPVNGGGSANLGSGWVYF